MKLKFWKRRGDKGAKGKRRQEAKSCSKCEESSKKVEGELNYATSNFKIHVFFFPITELEHHLLEMTRQKERLDGLYKMIDK